VVAGVLLAAVLAGSACELPPFAATDRASALLLAPGLFTTATPLGSLWAQTCALLPLGPLSFRVTLGFSLLGALAGTVLYRVLHRALGERVRSWAAGQLALFAALLVLSLAGALDPHPRVHLPGFVLAALALGALPRPGPNARSRRAVFRGAALLALLGVELFALASAGIPVPARDSHASDCAAADLLAELDRRSLPARSTLLLPDLALQTFRAAEAEERLRPDLTALPKPWPLTLEDALAIAREHPELQRLARSAVLVREVPLAPLRELAGRRPVLVQLEAEEHELFESVVPVGLLHQLLTTPATRSELRAALKESEPRQARLLARIATARLSEPMGSLLARRLRAHAEHLRDRKETAGYQRLRLAAELWLDPKE
jgi:hypothetical protein